MNQEKPPSYVGFLDRISLFGGYTSGILIFILMVLVSTEIFARNFFAFSVE